MKFLEKLFGKGPKLSVNEKGEVYPVITGGTIFATSDRDAKQVRGVKVNKDGSGMVLFDDLETIRARERRKREREEKARALTIPTELGDAEPPL
jgi:hypothetical protein